MAPTDPTASADTATSLEGKVVAVGEELLASLTAVVEEVPGAPHGPQSLARTLGLDKVLTSRLLKALRGGEPIAAVHNAPGPEPMRRLLRAAKKAGTSADSVAAGERAVGAFEDLIRTEAGDRSALGAMIARWLPEARAEFELRRKQSAFKALSELKGASADVNLATVFLAPAQSGEKIDVVWVFGLLGLRRWRPDACVKFNTRRMVQDGEPRHPTSLKGEPVTDFADLRLDAFCTAPPSPLEVSRVGDSVHYLIGERGFGPRSAADFIYAEANFEELARYVPSELGRKGYTFAQAPVPSKVLLFDVLVHRDVYPDSSPELLIYDTANDGSADVNDRLRDVDRWDFAETITTLGSGVTEFRTADVPRYAELLRHVFDEVGWDDREFRGYRVRIDYPLYCAQVAMAFDPPAPPK